MGGPDQVAELNPFLCSGGNAVTKVESDFESLGLSDGYQADTISVQRVTYLKPLLHHYP